MVITLFLLGYCAGPLVFAPLSEFYGRRYIFYITFLIFIAFNFLCAFAPNFGSLLVGRFLSGTFVSCAMSNSPGVLADIWDPIERGVAMAMFSMMTFVGVSFTFPVSLLSECFIGVHRLDVDRQSFSSVFSINHTYAAD